MQLTNYTLLMQFAQKDVLKSRSVCRNNSLKKLKVILLKIPKLISDIMDSHKFLT